jgi:hypothetical protein
MMRTFVLTLLALGSLIVVAGGLVISALVTFNRRREKRLASAHDAAVRFRRRYGEKAERAVARNLSRDGLSARKRRFYRAVAVELKNLDTLRDGPRAAGASKPAKDVPTDDVITGARAAGR